MIIDRATPTQAIFDHVVRGLTAQGARGLHQGAGRYRCPDGRRCAVGFAIADDDYHRCMEGCGVRTLESDGLLPAGLAWHVDLLAALERAHDVDMIRGSTGAETWPELVRRGFAPVADRFRLDPAVLP